MCRIILKLICIWIRLFKLMDLTKSIYKDLMCIWWIKKYNNSDFKFCITKIYLNFHFIICYFKIIFSIHLKFKSKIVFNCKFKMCLELLKLQIQHLKIFSFISRISFRLFILLIYKVAWIRIYNGRSILCLLKVPILPTQLSFQHC